MRLDVGEAKRYIRGMRADRVSAGANGRARLGSHGEGAEKGGEQTPRKAQWSPVSPVFGSLAGVGR